MAKLTIPPIPAGFGAVDALNDRFDLIEAAVEDSLSRSGKLPNSMEADLDMGGNHLINIGSLGLNLEEWTTAVDAAAISASSSASAASSSASAASSSASAASSSASAAAISADEAEAAAALLNTDSFLQVDNNLNDVANVATARTNLGLTDTATQTSTDSRTSTSTTTLLQAKAMNDHRTSTDHDGRYPLIGTLISAGTGLTGGGSLAANRTLAIAPGGVGTTQLAGTEQMSTANVLARTAASGAGAVGTYVFAGDGNATTEFGGTRAGSNLRPASFGKGSPWTGVATDQVSAGVGGSTLAGTWRCMGRSHSYDISGTTQYPATLWLRIS